MIVERSPSENQYRGDDSPDVSLLLENLSRRVNQAWKIYRLHVRSSLVVFISLHLHSTKLMEKCVSSIHMKLGYVH